MIFDILTDDNFILFAAKHYENPNCTSVSDFENDLRQIRYIKRLINKYYHTKNIKIQLLVNHVITFYNLFDSDAATRMLFLKLEKRYYPILKTVLLYLQYMPERVTNIRASGFYINSTDIPIDSNIASMLRQI